MVVPPSRSIEKFLSAPPNAVSGFLIYGTDAQQIAARGANLAKLISQKTVPPGDIMRLNETDIASDSARITVELETRPLFGGRKLLLVTGLPAKGHAAIIDAAARPPLQADLIIQAPDLKRSHKIVQAFEAASHLAAIPCYGEDEASLPQYIRQYAVSLGYDIDGDAAALVASRTNFSALLARSEIEKLAAFAGEAKKITLEDVEICLSDQRTAGAYETVDAALQGDGRRAIIAFERVMASEDNVVPVMVALSSSLQRLHALRAAFEQGSSIKDAIGSFRPPIFFKQHQAIANQVEAWSLSALEAALGQVNEAVKNTRLKAQLAEALTANLLLHIARKAREMFGPRAGLRLKERP